MNAYPAMILSHPLRPKYIGMKNSRIGQNIERTMTRRIIESRIPL